MNDTTWQGRTVLVTGAEGFIGSALVDELVALGAHVRALCHYKPYGAAGNLAREAARRYLDLEVPPFLIFAGPMKSLPSNGCAVVFPWQFAPSAGNARRLPSHVLPHEIGHVLFIRYLAPESGSDQYGGGAPDWLDEMAAMAFEDAVGVAIRRGEARQEHGIG